MIAKKIIQLSSFLLLIMGNFLVGKPEIKLSCPKRIYDQKALKWLYSNANNKELLLAIQSEKEYYRLLVEKKLAFLYEKRTATNVIKYDKAVSASFLGSLASLFIVSTYWIKNQLTTYQGTYLYPNHAKNDYSKDTRMFHSVDTANTNNPLAAQSSLGIFAMMGLYSGILAIKKMYTAINYTHLLEEKIARYENLLILLS